MRWLWRLQKLPGIACALTSTSRASTKQGCMRKTSKEHYCWTNSNSMSPVPVRRVAPAARWLWRQLKRQQGFALWLPALEQLLWRPHSYFPALQSPSACSTHVSARACRASASAWHSTDDYSLHPDCSLELPTHAPQDPAGPESNTEHGGACEQNKQRECASMNECHEEL